MCRIQFQKLECRIRCQVAECRTNSGTVECRTELYQAMLSRKIGVPNLSPTMACVDLPSRSVLASDTAELRVPIVDHQEEVSKQ